MTDWIGKILRENYKQETSHTAYASLSAGEKKEIGKICRENKKLLYETIEALKDLYEHKRDETSKTNQEIENANKILESFKEFGGDYSKQILVHTFRSIMRSKHIFNDLEFAKKVRRAMGFTYEYFRLAIRDNKFLEKKWHGCVSSYLAHRYDNNMGLYLNPEAIEFFIKFGNFNARKLIYTELYQEKPEIADKLRECFCRRETNSDLLFLFFKTYPIEDFSADDIKNYLASSEKEENGHKARIFFKYFNKNNAEQFDALLEHLESNKNRNVFYFYYQHIVDKFAKVLKSSLESKKNSFREIISQLDKIEKDIANNPGKQKEKKIK